MLEIQYKKSVAVKGKYDVIVVGGGVAGCAAAVAAAREGKKVILFEKTVTLGGLATNGLINLFEPYCNGRGTQAMFGMCEEFFRLAVKYGYDTIPNDWKQGQPKTPTFQRMETRFNVPVFSLVLVDLLEKEGVEICFDTVITDAIMEGKHCKGIITENKSGTSCYEGKVFVDASGDADLLARAGVPTVTGRNFHTYIAFGLTLDTCKTAIENNNVAKLERSFCGGSSNLHGQGHPENIKTYDATNADDVNRYLITNQLELFEKIKNDDRKTRYLTMLPSMAQFRTSRRIDGDYTFNTDNDAYKHFDDSVSVITDYERRDYLYEVSYRTLTKTGYDNISTAGRCASGEGYGWDIIRSIPASIATGQAAGIACSHMLDSKKPIYGIDIRNLQNTLEKNEVSVHFDDSLIPDVIENVYTPTGVR